MFYLRPVPWLRWLGAAAIVLGAIVGDLRGPGTEPYPFAAKSLAAGTRVDESSVDYRPLPIGVLPQVPVEGHLIVSVEAGTPILPSLLTPEPLVPDGWWVVDLPLASSTTPGMEVRVVVTDPHHAVTGIAVATTTTDALSGLTTGPVAIPPTSAEIVARAVAADGVVTMAGAGPPADS